MNTKNKTVENNGMLHAAKLIQMAASDLILEGRKTLDVFVVHQLDGKVLKVSLTLSEISDEELLAHMEKNGFTRTMPSG